MKNGYTSRQAEPLKRSEYLDCPNVCNSRSAKWKNGDAICPECGEMAVVYNKPKKAKAAK
jgi:hypothetical protein